MTEKITTVIVDDHLLVIEGVKNILADLGYIDVIATACNGEEALAILEEKIPKLIFLDINMPGMNGMDLCHKIKALYPSVYIIALSTFNEISYVSRMMQNGASGYLLKNASREEFDTAISQVLNNKKYFSEEVQMAILRERDILNDIPALTPREKEVLKLVADGLTNQQIANSLFLSMATIDTHRRNLFIKCKVNNVASLIKLANKYKMLD